jgi:hypothetical protein
MRMSVQQWMNTNLRIFAETHSNSSSIPFSNKSPLFLNFTRQAELLSVCRHMTMQRF